MSSPTAPVDLMTDRFGRTISYVRLSVTDRCDLRCTYCMAEDMVFLPKKEVLSLEEMITLCDAFIARGVDKIRLTGGEPLVRKGIETVIEALGNRVKSGDLRELTLTTNGTQLHRFSDLLAENGVKRINVSLDTLDATRFKEVTRLGNIDTVLKGIEAATKAGLKVKINAVALKGLNDHEIKDLLAWCVRDGHDLTLIETMPMGEAMGERADTYLPLLPVLDNLKESFALVPSTHQSGGPARYHQVADSDTKLGLITPLSNNFCATCNRVRVTATGRIYMCLGQDDYVDLRAALRGDAPSEELAKALDKAMFKKPKSHDFAIEGGQMIGQVGRHMSHTGG